MPGGSHAPYPAPPVDMQWRHITAVDTCPNANNPVENV